MDIGCEHIFVNDPVFAATHPLPPLYPIDKVKVLRANEVGMVKLVTTKG